MATARCSKDNIYRELRVSSSIRKSLAPRHRHFFETKRLISDLFSESGLLRPIL
jgi:hypothetical protein